MRRKGLDLCTLLILALVIQMTLASGCPSPILPEVTKCVQPLEERGGQKMMMNVVVSGIGKIKQFCRDGVIQEAFACLNRIYTLCAQSREDSEKLEVMVGVDKWKRAIINICNSYEYLTDNVECEANVNREFRPCAARALYLYRHEKKTKLQRYSQDKHMEKQMQKANLELGCSFSKSMLECVQIPYRTYCPEKMANLVIDAFKDFMPPVCVKRVLRTTKYGQEEEDEEGVENDEDEDGKENGEYGDKETDNGKNKDDQESNQSDGGNEDRIRNGEHQDRNKGYRNGDRDNQNGNSGYTNGDRGNQNGDRPRGNQNGDRGNENRDRGNQRGNGGKKEVGYNVPVVGPKMVTMAPPRGGDEIGGKQSVQRARDSNVGTEVQIGQASGVARSTNDRSRTATGSEEDPGDSSSAHVQASGLLVIVCAILRYYDCFW